MNSYEDLHTILSATDGLKNLGATNIHLDIPCFFAQRSDRPFEEGGGFDLAQVVRDIAGEGYKSVTLLHPHSDVLPAMMRVLRIRTIIKDNMSLVKFALKNMLVDDLITKGSIDAAIPSDIVLVSPDAGAYKQTYKIAQESHFPLVPANKYRDGKGPRVEVHGEVKDKVCLIIDDYCDGGRTFIELATKLKEQGAKSVFLCVTHGLFSAGLEPLFKVLEGVYTTNSISDIIAEDFNLEQLKVI